MSDQNTPEKLDLKSLDVAEEKQARLKALFPSVFTETKNEQGELVESLDFEKLKAELGNFSEVFEARRERYGMDWPGKKDCMKLIQQPSIATLRPSQEESVNFDTTKNLFIEGDNLEVLKILQKSYYGKVKMIYLDPPYNTGKEFIYPDKYAENLDTYLAYAGLIDGEGKKFATNTLNEGRFHTKWLNMMYPRLYLARNLLREDGVIFISIDDNEVENLKGLCNEVFGFDNFIGIFVVNSTPNARDYGHIGKMHEYALFYGKNALNTQTYLIPTKDKNFRFSDSKGGFNVHPLYNSNVAFNKDNRPNLFYPFYLDSKKKIEDNFYEISLEKKSESIEIFPPKSQKEGVQFVWRWGKELSKSELNKEIVGYATEEGEFRIVQKMRHAEKLIRSLLLDKAYSSRRGTAEVEELFEGKIFSFPKPVGLIKNFVQAATSNGHIILDFFQVQERLHIQSLNRL